MSTVKFGTICDLCGAGSRNYAHEADHCEDCGKDLCDACARETEHVVRRESDEGRPRELACPPAASEVQ